MFIIPLYTICLYSALYLFSRFVLPLARVYNFIYRNILKKSNINFFNPIFWCFRRAQKKWEVWGTSSVSQQYPKQSGKLQCTSSMFHTIKHLTFPKRKGNGQLTTWFSLCIFFLKPNEMLGGRGLSWRTGFCHIFIKVTTHKEFLYTYPNTDDAECFRGLSFIVLAQTARKQQNPPWTSFRHHSLNNTGDMYKIWSQKRVRRGTLRFLPVALIIFLEILRLQVMKKVWRKTMKQSCGQRQRNYETFHSRPS